MPRTRSIPKQAESGSARKRSRSPRSSHRLEESRRARKAQSLVNVSAGQASGSGNQTDSYLHEATGSLSGLASGAKAGPSGDPEIVNIFQDWAREDTPEPQTGIGGEGSPDEPANPPHTNRSRLGRPRRDQARAEISKVLKLKDEGKFVADVAGAEEIPRDTLLSSRPRRFSEGPVAKQHGSSTERTTKPPTKKKLTDEEASRIQALRDKGLCLSKVAEKTGCTLHTLQKRWQNTFGEPLRPKESRGVLNLTPDQVREVDTCLSKGRSFKPLCKKYASTKDAIMKAYRKAIKTPLAPLTGDQVSAIETFFEEKGAAGSWAEIASTLGLRSLTLADQFKSETGRRPAAQVSQDRRPLSEDEISAITRYFAEKGGKASWAGIAEQLGRSKKSIYRWWRIQVGDPPSGAERRSVPLTPDEIVMIEQDRSRKIKWRVIAEKMGKDMISLQKQYATGQKNLEIRQPKGDS